MPERLVNEEALSPIEAFESFEALANELRSEFSKNVSVLKKAAAKSLKLAYSYTKDVGQKALHGFAGMMIEQDARGGRAIKENHNLAHSLLVGMAKDLNKVNTLMEREMGFYECTDYTLFDIERMLGNAYNEHYKPSADRIAFNREHRNDNWDYNFYWGMVETEEKFVSSVLEQALLDTLYG